MVQAMDELRYFVARSGVEIRDQIIKACLCNCLSRESHAYERMLKALGTGLRTTHRKTRFKPEGAKHAIVTPYYKSAICIHGKDAVGFILVDGEWIWMYVKPEYRGKGISKELWKLICEKYPVLIQMGLERPYGYIPYLKKLNKQTNKLEPLT